MRERGRRLFSLAPAPARLPSLSPLLLHLHLAPHLPPQPHPQPPPTPEQVWRLLVDPKGEQQRVARAVKGGIGLAPAPRLRTSRHAGRQTAEREAGSPLSSVSEGRMVMRSSVSSVASSMADSPSSAVGTNTVEVLKLHARRRRHPPPRLRPTYIIPPPPPILWYFLPTRASLVSGGQLTRLISPDPAPG